ncbi:MAG: hypothetical protein J6X10_01110 [Bacteroidales bacterium]|nr:hypothetical protein [Bacteroidales bacterium]
MKRFFVFIIALAISLSINAQDYQKMWNEYNENISNLLPESAEKVLNKIEKQAKKDKNDVQLLKTVIKRCEIFNMKEEAPDDTIIGYCKSYLPNLSEASQVILKTEIARFKSNYDDIKPYKDNDFIKTVKMETYADLFQSDDSYTVYNLELEPTLYDYVMHCLLNTYHLYSIEDELYEKLLTFDLENNYTKAYYNNRLQRLGGLYNDDDYDNYSKLAAECTDYEFVAKIRVKQINYLVYKKKYPEAKLLCDETMKLLDKKHPIYKQCQEFNSSLTKKTISVNMHNVYVPNQTIPVGLTYRNTTDPSYKIFKVSSEEFMQYSQLDTEKLFSALFAQKAIANNTVKTTRETDYCEHSSLIALPALQCGIYYLVFSNNSSFKDVEDLIFTPFQVSNLSFFNLDTDDNLNLYVLDRETGEPMGGVTAYFTERYYNYKTKTYDRKNIGKAVSDKNGFMTAPASANRYFIDLYHNGDTLMSTMLFDFYKYNNNLDPTVKSRIFTDRAIYRPGQTVHFNCIVYRGNSKSNEVLPNYKTEIKFFDANMQLVDTLHLTTDEFGSACGSFTIPADRLNGYYSIIDKNSSTSIRVEEYKRPTFEVTFETPDKEYKIGDSVTVTGKVAALSGFGLDNVQYKYHVVRKTAFPYRFWYWVPYYVEDETISLGENTTSDDGSFSIDFKLSPSRDVKINHIPFYTYEIVVEATSKQGETQSGSFSISATYNKYALSVDATKSVLNINEFKTLDISAKTINGKPANTKVEYKIYRINDIDRYPRDLGDFDRQLISDALLKAYFPNFDFYADNSITKDIVYEGVIDVNGKAKLLKDSKNITSARYVIELRSADDTLSAFSSEYVVCDIKAKKMPYKSMYWTNIDKSSAQPGETINYYVGSSEKNISALVMVKSGRKILKQERVTLNNNIYKFSYKVREEDRGRLDFQVALVKYNTEMRHIDFVEVPFNNMKLDIVLNTERDKTLPGSTETWSVTVKDYQGNPLAVPAMAVMYDAALDNFVSLDWYINTLPTINAASTIMSDRSFNTHIKSQYYYIAHFYIEDNPTYSSVTLLPRQWHRYRYLSGKSILLEDAAMVEREVVYDVEEYAMGEAAQVEENVANGSTEEPKKTTAAKIRKDFNETAFFYPNLRTDNNGDVTFTFTMPDALTRWNFKLLAYSKDLKTGTFDKTIVTQQPLMIMADMPRFVYDEDTLWIAANVINLSDEMSSPSAKLEIFDENNNPVDLIISNKTINLKRIEPGRSQSVRWKVAMKKDVNPLIFRFSASYNKFSDAEQHMLPVLSTDIFMTQTYALTTKAHTNDEYVFDISNEGERNYNVKLEFNANPVYYVIRALPYLAEGEERYATTAFHRYFVNTLAQRIVQSNPNIKEILDEHEGDTLSELQKNEDVKAILLKETPWVLEAQSEARQRANVTKLFDTEAINANIASAMDILEKKQTVNGGWSWIDGMPESEYITQYILYGMGRLDIKNNMTEDAFHYLENQVVERYDLLDTPKKKKDAICSFMTMQDLLAMSYFNYKTSSKFKEAKDFYIKKLYSEWRRFNIEEQAHIALILNRNNNKEVSKLIIKSLRERALKNELGMYWRYNDVETQARILEAFLEIDPKEEEIDNMRLWILTQKRTNMWENDRATVEAIFAIMNRGTDWTEENAKASMVIGDDSVKVTVENPSNHVVWGGVFRQYFVPIDKVQKHNDAMKVKRELFVERYVDDQVKYIPIAEENIKVGDKVKIVISFENSQDMEFVYLKDLRGACFEPTEQLSRYHWSNGMWYYQSTTDVSMEFFIEWLSKGKHELSHTVYVTKEGSFSAGYSQIQCQYAPEFGAYSNGSRIIVN